jgi:hypothetical protein
MWIKTTAGYASSRSGFAEAALPEFLTVHKHVFLKKTGVTSGKQRLSPK